MQGHRKIAPHRQAQSDSPDKAPDCGRTPSFAANRALLKNMSLVGVFWSGYVAGNPNYPGEAHAELMRYFELGKIKPVVGLRGALADTPKMLRELANRNVMGKAVVEV